MWETAGMEGKESLPLCIPGHGHPLLLFSIYANSKTLTDNEDTELSALSASAEEAK